jgi:integrase
MAPQYLKGRPSPWKVQLRDHSGKVVTRCFTHKEDAEEFEASLRRTKKLSRAGLESPKDNILFIDYTRIFLKKRYIERAKSSVDQDEGRLRNYWLEKFGALPIQSITSAMIKENLDYIQFELNHSPADRNRHRALLHKLFRDAMMDDKVVYNPVSKIPLVDERKKTRKPSVLSEPKDQEAYIEAAFAEGQAYGVLATILIWAGPRISEAIALKNEDIDERRETITIRRIFERASQQMIDRTKGDGEGGFHVVPLFPRVKAALSAWRKKTPFIRPGDFVVHRADGQHISYDTFKEVHKRILSQAELSPITIHDLRRTFASNAQKAGYSKGEIQEMLGHSSVTVTERYTILEIDHLVQKGKRLKFGTSKLPNVVELSRGGVQ